MEQTKQVQSTVVSNTGPYATVPTAVQPAPQQQAIQARPAPQAPAGIPAYSSVIDGVTVAQTLVNDVIVDLQTKVINETQQQYYQDFTTGIPFGIRSIFFSSFLLKIVFSLRITVSDLHSSTQSFDYPSIGSSSSSCRTQDSSSR